MGTFTSSSLGILESPYFWGLMSALFLGLHTAVMIYHPSDQVDRANARSRRKFWGPISLVLTPLLLVLGLFFFPAPVYLTLDFAIIWSLCVLVSTLGFRFPRAAGIPLILISLVLSAGVFVTLQDWIPVRGTAEILELELWEGGDSDGKIRHQVPGREPWFTSVDTQGEIEIQRLEFPSFGSITGAQLWIRPYPGDSSQLESGLRYGEDLLDLLGWIQTQTLDLPQMQYWENWRLEMSPQGYSWRLLEF